MTEQTEKSTKTTETDKTETSTEITAETLPLAVREHLMRGQQQAAAEMLTETHGIGKADAEALIEAYRAALRERKIALDIQMMHEKNTEEVQERQQQIITWSVRIILLVFTAAMIYLLTRVPIK